MEEREEVKQTGTCDYYLLHCYAPVLCNLVPESLHQDLRVSARRLRVLQLLQLRSRLTSVCEKRRVCKEGRACEKRRGVWERQWEEGGSGDR